jgi:DNA-binding HxlR family transcriptional regulator
MLRTEKQRAALCTSCPVAKVADIIGDTCSLLVVRDLFEGPRRFGALDESLGMSTRTLTKTLRRLEEDGFIKRTDLQYALTAKGRGLKKVIGEMRSYGMKYL